MDRFDEASRGMKTGKGKGNLGKIRSCRVDQIALLPVRGTFLVGIEKVIVSVNTVHILEKQGYSPLESSMRFFDIVQRSIAETGLQIPLPPRKEGVGR